MQAHELCLFGGAILDIYWVYQSCQDPAEREKAWRQYIDDLDFVAPQGSSLAQIAEQVISPNIINPRQRLGNISLIY